VEKHKVIIIGGVACGPKTAARIKRLNADMDVTIIEKGEFLSYAGCGLPYYLSNEVNDYTELMSTPTGVVRDAVFFNKVKDVRVLNKTLAEGVDREKKVVNVRNLDSGETKEISYDSLVLAVGASPFIPPIQGVDLKGVYSLTTVEDARNIRDMQGVLSGKNVVVVGGGLIGLEAAEAFVKQGMNVTIVERLKTVLAALIDPEIAYHVHNELKSKGVNLCLDDSVEKLVGDNEGRVKSVVTEKGEFPVDFVLMAIGSRPNAVLAKNMGLEIGDFGAIKVDACMRTSDPDIFAGGDCVENINIVTGKPAFTPMGSVANKHGRVIADNICGKESQFKGVAGSAICKILDINISRTGLSEQEAKKEGCDYITLLSPSPDKPHFYPDAKLIIVKFVVDKKTRKLLGAQIVGPGDVAQRIQVAVTAVSNGSTVDEIGCLDLAYAPPFASAMDNIIVCANIARNKLDGIARSFSPVEVKEKIMNNEDFIFLDVRGPDEYEMMRIEDPRVKLIPLGKLRESINELEKEKEIICFCKISLRGYEAQRILEAEGFGNVKFMDGGVVCWPYDKFVQSA